MPIQDYTEKNLILIWSRDNQEAFFLDYRNDHVCQEVKFKFWSLLQGFPYELLNIKII